MPSGNIMIAYGVNERTPWTPIDVTYSTTNVSPEFTGVNVTLFLPGPDGRIRLTNETFPFIDPDNHYENLVFGVESPNLHFEFGDLTLSFVTGYQLGTKEVDLVLEGAVIGDYNFTVADGFPSDGSPPIVTKIPSSTLSVRFDLDSGEEDPNNLPIVMGAVVGALCLGGCIAAGLCLFKHKKPTHNKQLNTEQQNKLSQLTS